MENQLQSGTRGGHGGPPVFGKPEAYPRWGLNVHLILL